MNNKTTIEQRWHGRPLKSMWNIILIGRSSSSMLTVLSHLSHSIAQSKIADNTTYPVSFVSSFFNKLNCVIVLFPGLLKKPYRIVGETSIVFSSPKVFSLWHALISKLVFLLFNYKRNLGLLSTKLFQTQWS